MNEHSTWVGIDDHKMSLTIAHVGGAVGVEPIRRSIPNEDKALRRYFRRLAREQGSDELRVCYEAGPNGFSLKRRLEALGLATVVVVAPSLTPRRSGRSVKTDNRDAADLARLYRSGELTEIAVPDEDDEAARDLGRTYHQVRQEIMRKRHHILKFLVRRGRIFRDGRHWTIKHRQWLKGQRWDHWMDEISYGELLVGLGELEERQGRLAGALQRLVEQSPWRETAAVLRCFHGIDTQAAAVLATEVFDVRRFSHPRQLMSYLGLTPCVMQTGESERHGAISKTGNRHVRFLLGQIAWHYRHRPAVGQKLRQRREGQPAWAIAIADRAQRRLYQRYRQLLQRGKPAQKAVTAVARELIAFIWEVMVEAELRSNLRTQAAR